MTAEQNKALIVRLLGAMNAGDTKTIKENLTEDFVRHDMVEVFSPFFGKDGAGDFVEALHTGLPVTAGDDGVVGVVVNEADLLSILEERPMVALGMLGTLARRLVDQSGPSGRSMEL